MSDLSAVDTTLKTMESQIQAIKDRLQEERNAIPKAKKLIELSQRQQRKLQHMLAHKPSGMYESIGHSDQTHSSFMPDALDRDFLDEHSKVKEEPAVVPKVLRHLGRIQEARIGHHRVFTLSKPQ
ncbi:hypothetical protein COCNU_scaffold005770G000020 [Cocos nucifera]|nr:hypothetical protein [Cocos nucifera]